ncbi:MAG TPA: MFS transporter [archaeon]|nr:MFS transporter [archaeon]
MKFINSFFSIEANEWKSYFLFLLRLSHFFGAILVPFYLFIGGMNFFQILLTQAAFHGAIFLFEVPTGAVADKFGRKHSTSIGFLLMTIVMLLYPTFPGFYNFVLFEILFGLAYSFLSGADTALLVDSLKELKKEKLIKKSLSRFYAVGALGFVYASPIGSVLAGIDLRIPFYLTAVPYLLGLLISLTLFEPRIHSNETYFNQVKKAFKLMKSDTRLKVLAFESAFFQALVFFLFWFFPALLLREKVDIIFFGFVSAGMNLFPFIMHFFSEKIESILGRKNSLFLSSLTAGILFLLLAVINNLLLLIAVFFLIAYLRQLRISLLTHYFNNFVPSEKRATINSLVGMLKSIALFTLMPVIGFTMDLSLEIALIIIGVLMIVFALTSRIEEEWLLN